MKGGYFICRLPGSGIYGKKWFFLEDPKPLNKGLWDYSIFVLSKGKVYEIVVTKKELRFFERLA